jgi:hypothetical protein
VANQQLTAHSPEFAPGDNGTGRGETVEALRCTAELWERLAP